MMRIGALLVLPLLAGSALGQAYECRTPGGNIVRQYGVPCAPGRDTNDPTLEAERRKQRELEAERTKKTQETEAAVQRHDVRLGMTPDQVVQAWGNPPRAWTEESASGTRQVWNWPCADTSRPGNLVAFQKGLVSGIQRPCF